jgi:chloramphenicol-sensitive protein RarD
MAYVLWGVSPIFWRWGQGGAADILAFRIVSTVVFLLIVQVFRDRAVSLRRAAAIPGVPRLMLFAAVLLSINWLGFIWAVNHDHVMAASLGYFLTPLVSVLLGVFTLGEKLRSGQWVAVGFGAAGVVVLSADLGGLPWISLLLAGSFGLYGLLRKTAPVESLDGLTLEVSLMGPLAAAALVYLSVTGTDTGVSAVDGGWGWVWVLSAGVVTSTPLLLFANAARQIPLWLVGMLQYVTPTLQFLLGVLAYDEDWSGGQIVGYVVIWSGLVVFSAEAVRHARQTRHGRRVVY